jgi:AraC-like DNA-binding protein
MGPTTLASWALLIHRALTACRIDADALFRRAGMDPDRMRDPNARYPVSAIQRLWALAAAATDDPCFGLQVAQLWHPTTFHALGYSALASETLRDALLRAVRYSRVVTTGASLDLQQDGAEVILTLASASPGRQAVTASLEAGLASIVILCREARGQRIDPLRVTLARTHCGCVRGLQEFFGCPVQLGAVDNSVVFHASDLDARLPTANPVLLRVNEQVLTHYAARLESSELAVRVQSKLIQLLPTGEVDQNAVARSLNLSLRSMQRKLRDEGTTFRRLADDTRRQLGEQYLKDSTLVVSEIAYLLGFAEVSSFSRAFRRWTGHAPRETTLADSAH